VDFGNSVKTKYEVTVDLKYVKSNINNETCVYKAKEVRYRRIVYERIKEIGVVSWRKSIAEMTLSNTIIVHNLFPI